MKETSDETVDTIEISTPFARENSKNNQFIIYWIHTECAQS